MSESFLNDRVCLHCGDCLDVLAGLDENSIDSCVTDPPYHLTSIVQRFGAENAAPAKFGTDGAYARASKGFMSKTWDGGDIAFRPELWAAVYRVLKPGAHLVAFGGTRTYHRMACAIEDAGFEVRDAVMWLYGSGFPKSHDVSKGIDRAAGMAREIVGTKFGQPGYSLADNGRTNKVYGDLHDPTAECAITAPVTDAAREWQGWGTALKPACELIVLARKPLSEGTVAANVLRWGTGAINVDGCRVAGVVNSAAGALQGYGGSSSGLYQRGNGRGELREGRWPANVVLDGSDEVVAAFPEGRSAGNYPSDGADPGVGWGNIGKRQGALYADSGSAARFFFQAKPNEIEQVVITWISDSEPHQATLLVDTGQLPGRAIVASASAGGNGWSTFLSGNTLTDLFRAATTCTIRTATNSTTESRIWNYLISSLTSASIADVKYKTVNGGSPAANAVDGVQSLIITLGTTVSLPGASLAASKTQLKISVSVASQEQVDSAKRFWYGSKADADDRLGARHPTIKPLDLMQYLVRLVTPKGGLVLDPFAGTGTTGEAAWREGMRAVLIEREAEYQEDICRRMALALAGPDERARESIKARNLPRDDGPLFAHVNDYDATDDFARSIEEMR
jgi:site-specific DNA-methyltransferase (adenine-specific)